MDLELIEVVGFYFSAKGEPVGLLSDEAKLYRQESCMLPVKKKKRAACSLEGNTMNDFSSLEDE